MLSDFGKLASLLKNAPEMIRQAQQMQGRMGELKEKLARMRCEGTAGGGMVSVTCSGELKVVGLRIDPSLTGPDDREMMEDLIQAATNQALEKARTAAAEATSELLGGVGNMPGLNDLLAKSGLSFPGFPGGNGTPDGNGAD